MAIRHGPPSPPETSKNVTGQVLDQIYSTLRSFPLNLRRKFCYVVTVSRGWKYMIRTTYFYGGVNGKGHSSSGFFDQIVDGTLWGVVNTTADYADGLASYYEGCFLAQGKSISFKEFGMSLVARHAFGYSGPIIRFPDDEFDRFLGAILSKLYSPTSGVHMATNALEKLLYYIALYFAHDSDSLGDGTRVFDVSVNGGLLKVSQTLTLTPASGSTLAPLVNGGEMFELISIGGKTLVRDATALNAIKRSFKNVPVDWNGDPCMPKNYSWSGVTCSHGPRFA
ncbi:Leucine-rich repeat (LRR) family protein [Raphanus sativus]|nr:Leucine-rich repeat (LRR) family protein [Raphanus sativus]